MSEGRLIEVKNTLVHEDIFRQQFICNLDKCKGACCVEGNSGAPLLNNELPLLEEVYPQIAPYLTPKGAAEISKRGLFVKDSDGDLTTTCVDGEKECVYTIFENGVAQCAIERAYLEGKIIWHKPISCHLYPIRVTHYPEFDVLYYDRWNICSDACSFGKEKQCYVYQFLKEPLIRSYGAEWYAELEMVAEMMK